MHDARLLWRRACSDAVEAAYGMRKDRYRSPSPKLSSAPGVPDGYHDIIECACAVFDSDSNGCLVTSVGSRFGRHWASAGIVRRFSCLTIRPTPLLTEIRNISIEPTLSFSIVAGIRDCHSSLLDDVLAERIKTVVCSFLFRFQRWSSHSNRHAVVLEPPARLTVNLFFLVNFRRASFSS